MSETCAYLIATSDLSSWVEALLRRGEVIAPRAAHGTDVSYDVVTAPEQVAWEYSTSISPLKRFLFPESDVLFDWRRDGRGDITVTPHYDDTERIFLAARPCDVSGVLFLDRVFSRDREDVYYLRRRERSALVALACTEPAENCFCVCGHTGPFLETGYDLQLTPLGEHYLVEVGTEKGAALVQAAASLFTPAPEGARQARRELAREAENKFAEAKAYFAAAVPRVTFDRVQEEVWEEMGERCLSCGGCAFVCPTCYCFTMAASRQGGEGSQQRLWDSCLYETYTLEASGHNPRAERKHRLKARFFHKLSYQFVLKNGAHGCVGCGRCITACLGGNDMPAITAGIRRGSLAEPAPPQAGTGDRSEAGAGRPAEASAKAGVC